MERRFYAPMMVPGFASADTAPLTTAATVTPCSAPTLFRGWCRAPKLGRVFIRAYRKPRSPKSVTVICTVPPGTRRVRLKVARAIFRRLVPLLQHHGAVFVELLFTVEPATSGFWKGDWRGYDFQMPAEGEGEWSSEEMSESGASPSLLEKVLGLSPGDLASGC